MNAIYAFVQKVIQASTILVIISSVTPPFLFAIGPVGTCIFKIELNSSGILASCTTLFENQ
jgi:hypothetical protein